MYFFLTNKKTIAIIFGGASSEHEVSRVSAASVIRNINTEKFDVKNIGIKKDGSWFLFNGSADDIENGKWESDPNNIPVILSPNPNDHGLLIFENSSFKKKYIDAVFPVLHGKNGEDGTVQGLFSLAKIPFVGCDTSSSAVCMDKVFTNLILDSGKINRCKWIWFYSYEFKNSPDEIFNKAELELGYPMFVKPANAGSSVGIGKALNRNELLKYIEDAIVHDKKILIEEFIDGFEVECAVLGNEDPIPSTLGQIVPAKEFYDYEAKYSSPDNKYYIPAHVSDEVTDKIKKTAIKAFKLLGCEGLSRIDFFVRKSDDTIFLNEINTLPGFTSISMYPQLFAHLGIPYSELLSKLINLALKRSGENG